MLNFGRGFGLAATAVQAKSSRKKSCRQGIPVEKKKRDFKSKKRINKYKINIK